MQQGGEQHLALLPKPDLHQSNPCQHLLFVLLYLCYVNGSVCCLCPAHLAPQGLKNNPGCELSRGGTFRCLLSRAGPQVSHRKMVLGSIMGRKAGVRVTCTPSQEGRAAEKRSAGERSSALATLPKQLPPGLELPPLCKQRGHCHQLPALMEQIGLEGKQSRQRKQHMVIWVGLLGETCSCSRWSQGKFCL